MPRPVALLAAALLTLGLAAPLLAGAQAVAQPGFVVEGTCREGEPHGAYELKAADGKVRVVGAFNRGKRTGSFLFWTASGVRVAHLAFDEDRLAGTVALWYAGPVRSGATPQKLEAGYAGGRRNGMTRSWYASGRPRSEATYEDGRLVAAKAWTDRGEPLPEGDARAQAVRDLAADDATFRDFEALVRAHLPVCRAPAPRYERP